MPRQEMLSARRCGSGSTIEHGERGRTCVGTERAADRGFDLAQELPLRAQLFAVEAGTSSSQALSSASSAHTRARAAAGAASHCGRRLVAGVRCCADLGALYRARLEGQAAELAALPVQYADYTLWQRRCWARRTTPDSADRGSLRTGTRRWRICRSRSSCRPTGRVPRCRATAAAVLPICARCRRCTAGLLALARSTGASLFMVLQAGLAALLTRLGAGTDIAIGSPIAGRGDSALDELIGFFVNTLVLRTDTSGDPSLHATARRGCGAPNWPPTRIRTCRSSGWWRCCNPARSLRGIRCSRSCWRSQNDAARQRAGAAGADGASQPSRRRAGEVRPAVEFVERRGRDGDAAGSTAAGIQHRPVRRAPPVERMADQLGTLLAAAPSRPRRGRSAPCRWRRRRAAQRSLRGLRTAPRGPVAPTRPCRSCSSGRRRARRTRWRWWPATAS